MLTLVDDQDFCSSPPVDRAAVLPQYVFQQYFNLRVSVAHSGKVVQRNSTDAARGDARTSRYGDRAVGGRKLGLEATDDLPQ